ARRKFEQENWSYGVWTGFEWDFLDDFSLEGGFRWNFERKRFDFSEQTQLLPQSSLQERTWAAPTGMLTLSYKPSEKTTIYWKYPGGGKTGHFTPNPVGAPPAEPETIDAFETGLRGGGFFGDRFSFGAALFYYKYDNYQIFLFEDNPASPPTLEII